MAEERAAHFAFKLGEFPWVVFETLKGVVEFDKKPAVQTGSLVFVHKAVAWIYSSDCRWTTSRRVIRQISDLATCPRFLNGHPPMVGQQSDLFGTTLVVPESPMPVRDRNLLGRSWDAIPKRLHKIDSFLVESWRRRRYRFRHPCTYRRLNIAKTYPEPNTSGSTPFGC
jgi:hypothetical protein